ncbi:hypothetical protein Tco_0019403 [Tanacetum coccineum]
MLASELSSQTKNEFGVQLSAEQQDWVLDSDDEPTDQELKAHYMYMTKIQEVIPAVDEDTGPIYDNESLENVHKYDEYNVFAN